jgi:peptide deformylase
MFKIQLVEPEKIPKIISEQVDPIDLFKLANKMEVICLDNKGIGLSAVQVGIPWNFFIVNRDSKFEYYFNCSYEGNNDFIDSIEGCLSLINKDGSFKRFLLKRHSEVAIKGTRLVESIGGKMVLEPFEKKESGLYGIVFQHEIDHASDILISKVGKEILVT